jgi:hypothetical protein
MRWLVAGMGMMLGLSGCPRDTIIADGTVADGGTPGGNAGSDGNDDDDGDSGAGRAGSSAGRGGNAAGNAGRGGSDGGGAGGNAGGNAGSGGSNAGGNAGSGGTCPPNTAVPALCRLCDDGSCGDPSCDGSGFIGWRCPEDANTVGCDCGREAYVPVCGSDGQSYDATCGRECVPVAIACDGECPCDSGELRWYATCGDPVCGISPDPSNDPNIPDCTTEEFGDPCTNEGEQCDGMLSCGASLICTDSDPTQRPGGCPISRARFKDEIAYLNSQQLTAYHEQLMSLPLAAYRYRHAPGAGPQLGFIIEDIEPSVAVSGDHVNMYGYLSMAVAAIQVQQQQIASLQRELERVRAALPAEPAAACGP